MNRASYSLILLAALLLYPLSGPGRFESGLSKEQQLYAAYEQWQSGHVDKAITDLRSLTEAQPNFQLAQLLLGDLLASRAGSQLFIERSDTPTQQAVYPLIEEARQRWLARRPPQADQVPKAIVALRPDQKHAIAVDTSKSRLYLIEQRQGQLQTVADFYVSIGKNGAGKQREGDQRTPLGVYTLTQLLSGDTLPDKYGPMAFTLDYPNAWDRRAHRTGSGIWLHGITMQTYARPPQDSDGCVAMINEDLLALAPLIKAGHTPIVIGEKLDWHAQSNQQLLYNALHEKLERWRTDWESLNADAYLSHYATDFRSRDMNFKDWSKHKRRVNQHKAYIHVALREQSFYQHPGEQGVYEAHFTQQYESSNFNSTTDKVLYLKPDGQDWLIISELNQL